MKKSLMNLLVSRQPGSLVKHLGALAFACGLATFSPGPVVQDAHAQVDGPNCDAPFGIIQDFPGGSKWDMCWGYGPNKGVYYYNIYFTPAGGQRTKVIADGWISQIHVTYDNNEARFHDASGPGLGLGGVFLRTLTAAECPGGTLIGDQGDDYVCKRYSQEQFGYSHKYGSTEGYYLDVFSASQTGHYSYIPMWRFFADGTIELIMGASGKLERVATCPTDGSPADCNAETQDKGWLLDELDGDGYYGISHTHNYYWRLDFDLGIDDGYTDMNTVGGNDIVEQIEFREDATGLRRDKNVKRITTEQSSYTSANKMRSWRIRDPSHKNANGNEMAWYIEPATMGHSYVGANSTAPVGFGPNDIVPHQEEFARGDIFITDYTGCEEYVSYNNLGGDGNCAEALRETDTDGSSIGFINGEVVTDPVIYLKSSFHHTPRDEDEPHMPAHWNSIRIVPRNVSSANPYSNGSNINLTAGVTDSTEYGYKYGTNDHYNYLGATFTDSDQDMILTFDAFDIDNGTELEVRLNGETIGNVLQGKNQAYNKRASQFFLPQEIQIDPGSSGETNIIEFVHADTGSRWGVRNLMITPINVTPIALSTGATDTTKLGYKFGSSANPEIITYEFTASGTGKKIGVWPYDSDSNREISVFLNGILVYYLGDGPDQGVSGKQNMFFEVGELNGTNRLVFVQSGKLERWGIDKIKVVNN